MNTPRILILSLLVAALVTGCGREDREPLHIDTWREVAPLPRASEGLAIVVSAMGIRSSPDLHWYGGGGLDCPDGLTWLAQTADHGDGECVAGLERGGVIALSDIRGERPLHLTDLAHEAGHWLSEELGEGGDPFHTGHVFAPGGEMDQATAALTAAGM